MDEILLKRLSTFASSIQSLANSARTLGTCRPWDSDKFEQSTVTASKLQSILNRFNADLYQYFNTSTLPNADEVSSLTTIQLEGEEALAELNARIQSDKDSKSLVPNNSTANRSKLPELNLQTFRGDVLSWHPFWDQFNSNIGQRNLQDVDKLLYLKASLEGEAKNMIDGLETTNENYMIAVNTLKERFGRREKVVDAHYSTLYKLKQADKFEDCRRTLDEIERHLRVLQSLGEDVNHNHLRFLIMEKFPEDIIYEVKLKMGSEFTSEIRRQLSAIISAREDAKSFVDKNKIEIVRYTAETLHVKERRYNNKRKFNKLESKFNSNKGILSQKFRPSTSAFTRSFIPKKRQYEQKKDDTVNVIEQKRPKIDCVFCQGDHFNDQCTKYKTIAERKEKLGNRCYRCFRVGHPVKLCHRDISCIYCYYPARKTHNRALCPKKFSSEVKPIKTLYTQGGGSTVLQTAVVNVIGQNGTSRRYRILMDSGSQRNYVTNGVAKELNLKVEEENHLFVFTFGAKEPQEIDSHLVKLLIQTKTNEIKSLFANVVPSITQGVSCPGQKFTEDIYGRKFVLADDGTLSDRVDILIGNDYYYSLMSTEKIQLKENLYLIDSEFGWILSGKINDTPDDELKVVIYFQSSYENRLNNPDPPLDVGNVKSLWELESIGITDSPKIDRDEEAMDLYKDTKQAFQEISMNIRQWSSNSKELMARIPDTCDDEVVKTLGLNWDLNKDTLQLRFKDKNNACTKRGVLKTIASIYDPCGFAAPVVLPAKLLLQSLWEGKYQWDAPLPEELATKWKDILKDLELVKDICLPRNISKQKDCQLHCFTDSSTKAYSAVVYLLQESNIKFDIGKSRLAPIKNRENLKIPRLELLSLFIGNRLIQYVAKYVIWSDSQIVISWYHSNKLLTPFVSRRMEEIKRNKALTVKYIPSELNPADIATRPIKSSEDLERWLNGPAFLLQDSTTWPSAFVSDAFLLSGERLTNGIMSETESHPEKDFRDSRNENYTFVVDKDLNRSTEDHLRDNPQNSIDEHVNISSEVQEIIKIQRRFFPDEISGKKTHLVRNLGLFTDVDGVIRCEGRLAHSDLSYDAKHPILLPKDCDFTNDVIKKCHVENYHVGVPHTLSIVRRRFWIPQGRSQVQRVINKCPECVKHGGGPYALPSTPDLPPERVRYESSFAYVGIDYFGPMLVKSDKGQEKRWICLFTCLVIRAIHLEVVKDMSTEECSLAFRRFIATRGVPILIVSDNALQFKLLSELLTRESLSEKRIKWKFIPQLAPWHGGAYERLVAVVKHCLKRTLQKHLLGDNQLLTIIKEVEAIVNTRPLTYVGTDIEHVLKPADFLSPGKCINVQNFMDNITTSSSTSTKQQQVEGWKRGEMIMNEYKDMFINQYLLSLRERYNHSPKQTRVKSHNIPRIGDVVQIKGETKNQGSWKVGRITELLKGADGLCRDAKVKVGDTVFTRSIAHLYPLEAEEFQPSDVPFNDRTEVIQTPNISELDTGRKLDLPEIMVQDLTQSQCEKGDVTEDMDVTEDIDVTDHLEEACNRSTMNENAEVTNEDANVSFEDVEMSQIEPIPTQIHEERNKRAAAVQAMEKIKEWTLHLMTTLTIVH